MQIVSTLNNYPHIKILNPIISQFSNNYVFENGVFLSKIPPICPNCGKPMVHNGSNSLTKKNIATIKIRKYRCLHCGTNIQESRDFFDKLLKYLQDNIAPMILKMRWNKLSYRGIEEVLAHILPIGKDTIYQIVRNTIESIQLPEYESNDFQIIGYDEQYVRINGLLKYRILIYDFLTGTPIIDTLIDAKTSESIKKVFLKTSLNFSLPTVVVTDLDNSYPQILDELFGENLIHQPCLFHLQKLICKSYSKNCSIFEEMLKYKLLNIFYDHDQEIEWLSSRVDQEKEMIESGMKKEYNDWLIREKKEFRLFCKTIKKDSSESDKKRIRSFEEIMDLLLNLIERIEKFPIALQNRLKMMDKIFLKLTNFCDSNLIPTTNNGVENYFFRTLNMDWKKRMKTEEGFLLHLKLQAIRLNGVISKVNLKFTDLSCVFQNLFGCY